jgi:small-conductance mechanosensitive channel
MHTLWTTLEQIFANPRLVSALRAAVVFLASWLVARLLSSIVASAFVRASPQQQMLGRRVVFYGVLGLGVASAMDELGFSMHTLLGAAGLATVALGLAAQTSTSNFIAGLFLIAERPFVIGDIVRIGNTKGEVLSIDLLSIKLRTDDNLYIRVPNETVVKAEVANLTHFPIRRIDLALNVGHATDLERLRELLADVAKHHPLCLEEPKPQLLIEALTESSIELQFSFWCARAALIELKSAMYERIKQTLEHEGIALSTPQAIVLASQPPTGSSRSGMS